MTHRRSGRRKTVLPTTNRERREKEKKNFPSILLHAGFVRSFIVRFVGVLRSKVVSLWKFMTLLSSAFSFLPFLFWWETTIFFAFAGHRCWLTLNTHDNLSIVRNVRVKFIPNIAIWFTITIGPILYIQLVVIFQFARCTLLVCHMHNCAYVFVYIFVHA